MEESFQKPQEQRETELAGESRVCVITFAWSTGFALGARCSSVVRACAHGCDGSSDRSFLGWTH